MKKRVAVLILILAGVLFLYVYSLARPRISLPRPEDMAGKEASAFLPQKIHEGKPAARGSSELKVTGPVWVDK